MFYLPSVWKYDILHSFCYQTTKQHLPSDQKLSNLTLDKRLDSHYSQPGGASGYNTSRLNNKDEAGDR